MSHLLIASRTVKLTQSKAKQSKVKLGEDYSLYALQI